MTTAPEKPVPSVSEHHLVTEHLGLARAIAERFTGRGPEKDDLQQVAYLGLVKAARRYDPGQGSFTTFAVPTVTGELKRHFRDRGWMVRPPRWVQELQADVREIVETYEQRFGTSPDDAEIAARLDTSPRRVREARGARGCFAPRSIDAPTQEWGPPVHETVATVDPGYGAIDDRLTLAPAYRKLTDDDRALLSMRFIDERTQQDIADELGVSQMQVSRRLSRIMSQLRSTLLRPDAA